MNNLFLKQLRLNRILAILVAANLFVATAARSEAVNRSDSDVTVEVSAVKRVNPTSVDLIFDNNQRLTFDFYGSNIFRLFQDNSGGIIRDPKAEPEAQILVDSPRVNVEDLNVSEDSKEVVIETAKIKIVVDKQTYLFTVTNLESGESVIELAKPIEFEDKTVVLTLKGGESENYFGGGVQNGRFSHKNKKIAIENQNSWTDGGVASPTPFYWSTAGYGVMWHTFKKGSYDFGATNDGEVILTNTDNYLDLFFMVNDGAVALLNDFYQLTGNPVFMPKFGFYQGHLNAYNRDYWSEVEEGGVLFEDGKRYKESSKSDKGVRETLNGEKGEYQFSARAVIDRYKLHDMPLGWLLPNDGYGAGYGQDSTLDGNIQNLANLTDYARENGVEIGLWTQSDLHPKEGVEALLQRDIVKEVRDAGVRVLKTDVAWVGAGYSFGLNGVADVANIMQYYGSDARPFIISIDGWAGTQRYAGIWSGDQSGGNWEYISFHIPTYLGSGLSGQPNISSDMDGIFGGQNPAVNSRDFQWKTFTPQQLNMDGWGANEKYPHALGEPVASINRFYLKLRSSLMPYLYSTARESVDGLPIVRAMFLEYPNRYTYSTATQYQFLSGSNFLVAPIYQATESDDEGNDIRDGIYLPEGEWIDYLTGQKYSGGVILNNFDAPLWKLPIFVKNGAIIPMTNPNNHVNEIDRNYRKYEIYPSGSSSFVEYDDDGVTMQYKEGVSVTTLIESNVDKGSVATITVHPAEGDFDGFEPLKRTEFVVNVTAAPAKVTAMLSGKKLKLTEAKSLEEYNASQNLWFYNATPNLNQFSTKGSKFADVKMIKNPQIMVKLSEVDITATKMDVVIAGFEFKPADKLLLSSGALVAPKNSEVSEENITAYTLKPTWDRVENADYYQIKFDDQLYSTIKNNYLLFSDLKAETSYNFELRAVNSDSKSDWVEITATTDSNPLEFAITGLTATATVESQGSQNLSKLFDFDLNSGWHTKWDTKVDSFDMVIDLNTINQIEKLHYLPRQSGGNGVILEGRVSYSYDKENWSEPKAFVWAKDDSTKIIEFEERPTVRYIKLSVSNSVGGFGSGREIYVFKVPGTSSFIPGDINNDRLLDMNDITSYKNYTGLRFGDSDFEGYVSIGDGNKNNLIDAYDISQVAIKLRGGVKASKTELSGGILFSADKSSYKAGEEIIITVKGDNLKDVNALSFALPYDPTMYEYISTTAVNMGESENMTNDRLHTNGVKSLYPTFVNIGDKESINGSEVLFVIKFKAKQNVKFDLKHQDAIIVDKNLNSNEL